MGDISSRIYPVLFNILKRLKGCKHNTDKWAHPSPGYHPPTLQHHRGIMALRCWAENRNNVVWGPAAVERKLGVRVEHRDAVE